MNESKPIKSQQLFEFENKRYDFSTLDKESRQLVNAIRKAEGHIKRCENTMKLLKIGHQTMKKELREKLLGVTPLNQII